MPLLSVASSNRDCSDSSSSRGERIRWPCAVPADEKPFQRWIFLSLFGSSHKRRWLLALACFRRVLFFALRELKAIAPATSGSRWTSILPDQTALQQTTSIQTVHCNRTNDSLTHTITKRNTLLSLVYQQSMNQSIVDDHDLTNHLTNGHDYTPMCCRQAAVIA